MYSSYSDGHAFIFQGVGLEYKSYLDSLQEEHKDIFAGYFDRCKNTVGIDLSSMFMGKTDEQHNRDLVDLIAIFTINCAVYEIYKGNGIKPKVFLGYSMGLYTALVCGGAITFEQGLRLLTRLHKSLELKNGQFEGGMGVIIGLTYGEVKEIIEKACLEDGVEIASENNNTCIVISGHKQSVDKVLEAAVNEGALKTKEIDVLYPYHSRFVEKGSDEFIRYAERFLINDLAIPIVSSFDQKIIKHRDDIMEEIRRSLTGRMFWRRSIEKVGDSGINSFVEVGLGNSLSRLSKIININYAFSTFEKIVRKQEVI